MSARIELVWLAAIAAAGSAAVVGASAFRDPPQPVVPVSAPGGTTSRAASPFVNFETPHVHPIAATPDNQKLLVCNTAAGTLDVFSVAGGVPQLLGSVPVGVDPVAVRARTSTEAWVVNHVSDSVSIVDLTAMNVVRSLKTLDEPCDVVFAGATLRAFVSCSQANALQVFDPADLNAAPLSVAIEGDDPRALAVSPDGATVYAAVFESGNASTSLGGGSANPTVISFPPNAVSDPAGPYAGVNPPPNRGTTFDPPLNPNNPAPIPVSLIVKKDAQGRWMDDNSHDWTSMVSGADAAKSGRVTGWDLPDRDLAVVEADTLSVTYARGLMNLCMSVGVNPATGVITVVGTDATNEVRFEPVLSGRFIRVNMASVDPLDPDNKSIVDLNPHLDYQTPTIPQSERNKSIGDPRAIAWNSAGTRGYVAGLGSNNLVVIDPSGARAGLAPTIEVGEGPTGLVLDEARARIYVLNRFEASISIVDLNSEVETGVVKLFDPTPLSIRQGRPHLYDTHKNSGLGHIACASCHVDARMDKLAWDLGDPGAGMAALHDLNLGFGLTGLEPNTTSPAFEAHHPMKGPMTTQTLQDIIGKEPHHWRGDRAGLEAFAPAFIGLQGDDTTLTTNEMQQFENFLASIHFPPNPFRNFDNTLPTSLPLPGHYRTGRFGGAGQPLPNGNAAAGLTLYRSATRRIDRGAFACVTCHTLPTGAGPDMTRIANVYQQIPLGPLGEHHLGVVSVDGVTNVTMKVPQTRNVHEKSGFNMLKTDNLAGFGFLHDGSIDSIERFVSESAFNVNSDQEVANLVAFLLCLSGSDLPAGSPSNPLEPPGPPSQDAPASVGAQTTLVSLGSAGAEQIALMNSMFSLAGAGKVGLIAKGRVSGSPRGWAYTSGGTWQSDEAAETISTASLQALAAHGSEITFTVVPLGSQTRLGIDRDLDGCFDRDEALGRCGCPADFNRDGFVNGNDFDLFSDAFAVADPAADFNQDGFVNADDYDAFAEAFDGAC